MACSIVRNMDTICYEVYDRDTIPLGFPNKPENNPKQVLLTYILDIKKSGIVR